MGPDGVTTSARLFINGKEVPKDAAIKSFSEIELKYHILNFVVGSAIVKKTWWERFCDFLFSRGTK